MAQDQHHLTLGVISFGLAVGVTSAIGVFVLGVMAAAFDWGVPFKPLHRIRPNVRGRHRRRGLGLRRWPGGGHIDCVALQSFPVAASTHAEVTADITHVPPLRNSRRLVHGFVCSPVGGGLPVRPRRDDAERSGAAPPSECR